MQKKIITVRLAIISLSIAILIPLGGTGAQSDRLISPDIVYGHKDGMALTFDVFRPEVESNGAGILYMVSGGWFSSAPARSSIEPSSRRGSRPS